MRVSAALANGTPAVRLQDGAQPLRIDNKHRFAIPAQWKAPFRLGQQLIVVKTLLGEKPIIKLFTGHNWEAIKKTLSQDGKDRVSLQCQTVTVDKLRRIVLPQNYYEHLGLAGNRQLIISYQSAGKYYIICAAQALPPLVVI